MFDCVIIGGGISGVSFAHYINHLSKDKKSLLIVESESRLGGRIYTHRLPEAQDYWVELGAHTCYNSYVELIKVLEEAELINNVLPREKLPYKVYSSGTLKGFVREISFPSLACHAWRYWFSPREGKTTREYFMPMVGRKNYEKVFSKLFRAVISQEAHEYPAEMFLKQRSQRRVDFSRSFTYQGGLGKLISDLAEKSLSQVRTGLNIISISQTPEGVFILKTHKGEIIEARSVALATGVEGATSLLRSYKMDELSDMLTSVQSSKSIAINVLVDKNEVTWNPIAGIVPLSNHFYSAVSHDMLPSDKWRSFTFHFPGNGLSFAERVEVISQTLGTGVDTRSNTVSYGHTLPALRISHLHFAQKAEPYLEYSGLFLLGNYFKGMSLEDCVCRSRDEALRWLKEQESNHKIMSK